jgi:hypothetical protein
MTDLAELNNLNLDDVAKLGDAELAEIENLEASFNTVLEAAPSIKGAMKAHGCGSKDLWMCDPTVLKVIKGFNPRVFTARYQRRIEEYAQSMLVNGWFPNSVLAGYTAVENGEIVIYITAGHTRLLSLALANKKATELGLPQIVEVPVTVKTKGVSMDDLQVELIRGNADSSLTPYEQGIVIQRLVRAGHDEAEIEVRTGVKNPWMGKLLKLMAAPHKLKMLVAHEFITATLAIDVIEEFKGKALQVIEEAMAAKAAKSNCAAGDKVHITKRDIRTPEQRTAKAVAKFAPTMHQTLNRVFLDPGVRNLRPETQTMLAELIDELKKAQAKAAGEDLSGQVDTNQTSIFDAQASATA